MRTFLLAALLLLAAGVPAQGPDGLPTLRSFDIAPGALLDLDAGVVLREAKVGALQADMQFGRDGLGFYLEPLLGGMRAKPGDVAPAGDDWSRSRIRLGRRSKDPVTAFLKTSHGVARVSLAIVNPYSVASASVHWVVVPPTDPLFLSAPDNLKASWQGPQGAKKLRVSWSGEQSRYMVEVRSGNDRKKELVSAESITFAGLDPDGVHEITVRGLENGAISLPGTVVRYGQHKVPQRAVLEYADNWYDVTGGLSLEKGKTADEDAEVVFYLYGVYVPGGGVQKLGSGRAVFEGQSELPTTGYLPSYGRLDEFDVYAVRLRDGRYGMIWLDPFDGGDVRNGMRVHTVFLPDGRRDLLPVPVVTSTSEKRVVTLSWAAVPGATSYSVAAPGRKAKSTQETSIVLRGLPRDQVHEVQVVAKSELGERSPPGLALVHTYGFQVHIGRVTLPTQRGGFDFGKLELEANKPVGLQLVGGAGSGQGLSFKMDGMFAPMGDRKYRDLTKLRKPAKGADTWYSSNREPESEEFLVFPTGGGCAMVKIVLRGFPSTIEYLWVPELPK